jgi:branched-chain amino acid transport system substrate-binding protein
VSHIDRRQALRLFAALGAAGLTGACNRNSGAETATPAARNQIRIGMIAPQTGGSKAIGDDIVRGFRLFLDLNGGQIGGHPVELVVADEGDTVDTGKAALGGLLKQGVLALTGVVNSDVMAAIRDTVEQARVPLIGSNASPSALQGVFYIWRTSYVNTEPGLALGPYVARQIGAAGRVGIIAPNYEAGHDSVEGFRTGFGKTDPRLLPPVWTEFTTAPTRTYFREKIDHMLAANPTVIYCFYAGLPAVEFLKQLWEHGYRGNIYAPGFLTEGTVLDEFEHEADNVYTALNYSPDLDNAANRQFATAFRNTYGATPTTYAVASYDAAQVLQAALRLTPGLPTSAALNQALGRIGQIDSPRGGWQLNQTRTPQQRWYLRQVQKDGPVLANVLLSELATLG